MDKKKILLPFVHIGQGHRSFALAIIWFIRQKRADWEIRLFEPGEELGIRQFDALLKDSWKRLLAFPPWITRLLFVLEKLFPRIVIRTLRKGLGKGADITAGFLLGYKPDFIMSTHWGCTMLMDMARKRGNLKIPLHYIFTELGGSYAPVRSGADRYYSLCGEATESLKGLGIEEDRIEEVAFVTAPLLLKNTLSPEEARRELGIPEEPLTVLLSLGGEGIGPVVQCVEAFLKGTETSQILVLTGKNATLYETLKTRFSSPRAIFFPFLESVNTVMSAADIFAGKSGTSFTLEAAVLQRPLAVVHLGAPNEEENMKYLVGKGFGWFTPRPEDFSRLIKKVEEDRTILHEVVDNVKNSVPQKNGAEEIAEHIISLVEAK